MKSPFHFPFALPAFLVAVLTLCLPAMAVVEEGVVDRWGESILVLREPVVSRTVVENSRRLSRLEDEERRVRTAGDGEESDEDEGEEKQPDAPSPRPTAEDCGLELFTVSSNPAGAPAPRLRWQDQNKLSIAFAPGSSPQTEYRLVFKPGTTYLSGEALATAAFSFRCKPVSFQASWLSGHAGGAALLSAAVRDTLEAQQIADRHSGLRVCFRRLRHVPLVGWVCTGTVPARLRPATLGDGLGEQHRNMMNHSLMKRLLASGKPESLREDSLLPHCLVALPQRPLVPGASYELGVEAAPGSGFESDNLSLGFLSQGLTATLERELVQEEGSAPGTRLKLHFSHPVPEVQLRGLWEKIRVQVGGKAAERQADGSLRATVATGAGEATVCLRLRSLIACSSQADYWGDGREWNYSPKGCAQGLEIDVQAEHPLELCLTLPEGVQARHGLPFTGERVFRACVSPAAPALAGNGCNYVAFSGAHTINLPLVNVGEVRATAYHWGAEDAARLLPVIQHGMRDDTVFCELYQRLAWLRRCAAEGLSTDGMDDDARTEAGRALRLLQKERQLSDPLRAQALAAATAFEPQVLAVNAAGRGNGLLSHGFAGLDLDKLTGQQLRPGLYLISLTYSPTPDVRAALRAYGMKEDEAALPCSVDFLVQVTDMSLRLGGDRLMVNSLVNGQPLGGGQVAVYDLPGAWSGKGEKERLESARAEARPTGGMEALPVVQGEAVLPELPDHKLLLVKRGEDYTLFSLWNERVRSFSVGEKMEPRLALFCDRPLYRPGEEAHLRGVLRRPVKGGLALPRAKGGTLTLFKPNGDVLETREVVFDAYGALATDVTLPVGEEDITGDYRCLLQVEEGGRKVQAEKCLRCEVFRRDAFKAKLDIALDPVAPKQYKVEVQATDYNGTPLAGGKVELRLGSTAPLRDGEGKEPEGLRREKHMDFCELTRSLVLDAEGRASVDGCFGTYEKERILNASASLCNDREEYVQLPRIWRTFSPADFVFCVEDDRLYLRRTRREEGNSLPLDRAQEVEICVVREEEKRVELPSGLWYMGTEERVAARHRITVPADCREGVDLSPWLEAEDSGGTKLCFSARDAAGRLIRDEYEKSEWECSSPSGGTLRVEGRTAWVDCGDFFTSGGTCHAYVSSQGRLRHVLVEKEPGAKEVSVELAAQEYGEVGITLVACGKDDRGTCTKWTTVRAHGEVPRPDKVLTLEFSLPEGAKPGERVAIRGRVLGADAKLVKAAVTLFAVDAGMMSVAPYTLPELAAQFYRGEAGEFSLAYADNSSCELRCLTLPDVWARSGGHKQQRDARSRSLIPAGMGAGSWGRGEVGAIFRNGTHDAVLAAQPDFHWSDLLNLGQQQMQYEAAPAPAPVTLQKAADYGVRKRKSVSNGLMTGGLRSGSGALAGDSLISMEEGDEESPPWLLEESLGEGGAGQGIGRAYALADRMPRPRLRSNFEPVALWLASLESGEDGAFVAECTLPDTLTTYKVCAVALDAGGTCFGQGEGEFLVNQPLMLTAGTPFFMSTGDRLLLPLTVTNNRDEAGEWSVTLEGVGEPAVQQVKLEARQTDTLFFEVRAGEEGECTLRWTALSADGADAVEGRFPVRFPAPLLKEAHRLVLAEGAEAVQAAGLLAAELAGATRGEVEVACSTSPLIHLAGGVDFLLNYPYGCTEQRASALLPWIFYGHLSPFCPQMAMTPAEDARATVARSIEQLLARQQEDGGLSYWAVPKGERGESCAWASAYAGLVLTLAEEQGFAVPKEALEKLRKYLGRQSWRKCGYQTQYAVARARGRSGEVNRILVRALRKELKDAEIYGFERDTVDLEFMGQLSSNPAGRHAALLEWMRSKGRDYRHRSSWQGGWTLIALAEYLRLEPRASGGGSVWVNGEEKATGSKPMRVAFKPAEGQRLAEVAPELRPGKGTCYVSVNVKAQPEQTEYPGVTEKGLQVTRLYEVKDAAGQWREARDFKVGDVVRVTLTCAKIADELEYFVLEDYLPSCMEAINPNVPGQAAGLEDGGWGSWSRWFDHKEYLADRVRGFCTRWVGRDLVNMSYYARVKRAGESVAPPAAAQLMYEPQTYGLSPNRRVKSE